MNIKLIATIVAASALMLPLSGYAADTDANRSSPKTFVKDSVITTKIKTKLAEEKVSSLVHISVDTTDKGAVTLSGNAKSQAAIDTAISIARAVSGVTSVESSIKIVADK
jgi:hyperosmotically inducible protein